LTAVETSHRRDLRAESPDLRRLRSESNRLAPLVEELHPAPDAAIVFRALTHRPHCLFLDSARRHPQLGRYSFITADPFDWVCASADEPGAFDQLAKRLGPYQSQTIADLPPFQGGGRPFQLRSGPTILSDYPSTLETSFNRPIWLLDSMTS